MNTKCDSIVQCFITSTHPQVHLFATIILAYLERKLTMEECENYCKLKNSDVKTMLELLAKPNNLYLSVTSLLKALQVLLSVDKDNTVQFLNEGIMAALPAMLVSKDCAIVNETSMTLWLLVTDPNGLISVKAHPKLIQSLNSLKGYDDHNTALILDYILRDIAGSIGS